MTAQDDKSEICGLAARLEDVAQLYEAAEAKVDDGDMASCLRAQAQCRRQMANALLARAGLSGDPPNSPLPLPEAVWMTANSLLSGSDEAVIGPLRSADGDLLEAVRDYLDHSTPSARAASAAQWLRERLEREVGACEDSVAPPVQPG